MVLMDQNYFIDLFQKEILKKKGHKAVSLATVSNGAPNNRTVILRSYDREKHDLVFYTHALSQKVQEIKENPSVSLVWYFSKSQVQIQVFAQAKVIEDQDSLKAYFSKISPASIKDYLGLKPGSLYQENNDSVHFCAIELEIDRYIFLKLGREEHLKFDYFRGEDGFSLSRLIP